MSLHSSTLINKILWVLWESLRNTKGIQNLVSDLDIKHNWPHLNLQLQKATAYTSPQLAVSCNRSHLLLYKKCKIPPYFKLAQVKILQPWPHEAKGK